MNTWNKVGIAVAAVTYATVGAHAQSVVLFSNVDTISGGTVSAVGNQVTSVLGTTANLSAGLPSTFLTAAGLGGSYTSNVYTVNYTVGTGSFQLLDSGSNVMLGGTLANTANLYSSSDNPSFILFGSGTLTSGTWLDAIRIASAGTANNQIIGATLGFTGLPSGRIGADQLYLSVTAVPEPGEWAAMGMLGTSLGALLIRSRRRAK